MYCSCFLQTSRDGKVASGTQVVLHEAGVGPGLAAGLDRRRITHPAGGLFQSYAFLRRHSSSPHHADLHRRIFKKSLNLSNTVAVLICDYFFLSFANLKLGLSHKIGFLCLVCECI